ncbi:MAG: TRAP transporter substrate-binding protein DctP [Vicinamibacteria bacterium]|jgi:TRAP-type C4-dicarboxylate transport system substrate-binding protein|nr:TRAP transporter substrate-binding protein DctP [Vicinamibacteria bacterium]
MNAIHRQSTVAVALLACALALPMAVSAQGNVIVKMATLVPDGSSWHAILKETAEQWKTISGGRVTVRVFAGGVAGDDRDVVRKMRLGTLNSGVLTSVGVGEIDRSVFALGIPLMYASYEEMDYVLEKMRPRLEANLVAKGFVVLNWADGGWVHFFTQKPAATPNDLRQLKLFAWAGDEDQTEVWRAAGFNAVPTPAPELMMSLQTGRVSAVGVPPQVSIISQYFNHAKFMTDLKWQVLLGATVISTSAWERIPADIRPALLASARDAGKRLQAEIRGSQQRDVEAMQRRGLTVVPLDAQARALWQKLTESLYPSIRGKVVPADAFDEALRYRDEYRRLTPPKSKR